MNYDDILKTMEAKTNFIKGLIRLAKADGEIAAGEERYFLSAASELGLDEKSIDEIGRSIISNAPISIEFLSDLEKLIFFREGIQLCALDESYDVNEKKEVRALAAELDIPEAIIEEIEAWVAEGMEWRHRGDDLLTNYVRG